MRIAALAVLAACSRDPLYCATAAWTIDSGSRHAAVAGDGTVVLYFEAGTTAPFAGVTAPALVRLDQTGAVIASAPVTDPTDGGLLVLDDAGAPLVSGDSSSARFDHDFKPVWSGGPPLEQPDVAPGGQVAWSDTRRIHYLDAAGVERWTSPADLVTLRVAGNGDVFTYDLFALTRKRLAAADGSVIETVSLPAFPKNGAPAVFGRDGTYVYIGDPLSTVVIGTGADGAVAWMQPLHASTDQPVLAGDGTVVAVTDLATQVIRLDAATGAILARHDNCNIDDPYNDARPLLGASSAGYVLVVGSTLMGFAGP